MQYNDEVITLSELRRLVARFVYERHWQPYHTPKNLAMALAVEAAELMEVYLWDDTWLARRNKMAASQEELADIVIYCLALADVLGIDVAAAVAQKLQQNALKYPIGHES